jgi:hypothetical protein
MTTATISAGRTYGLPLALSIAQKAIHLPEVQAMLRRLSEYNLGIFMPHRHDEQTGDFQPLPVELTQVEAGLEVSFHPTARIAGQPDHFLPVGWCWRGGASTPISVCEMVREEHPGDAVRYGKHKMLGSN